MIAPELRCIQSFAGAVSRLCSAEANHEEPHPGSADHACRELDAILGRLGDYGTAEDANRLENCVGVEQGDADRLRDHGWEQLCLCRVGERSARWTNGDAHIGAHGDRDLCPRSKLQN
jgi:hypothetical protein